MIHRTATPTRVSLIALSAAVAVTSCHDAPSARLGSAAAAISWPVDAEAVGPRRIDDAPLFVAKGACKEGVSCLPVDVDGDRRNDLVRIDRYGVLGPSGGVWVAHGNGRGFGASHLAAMCGQGDACTVGDTDGDGDAEVIGFRAATGEVYRAELGAGANGSQPVTWHPGFCTGVEPRCQAADVSGDGVADLVWLRDDGSVEVALQKQGAWQALKLKGAVCPPDRACALEDVDGDGSVELVAISAGEEQHTVRVYELAPGEIGESAIWTSDACAPGTRCSARDMTGDGRADLIEVLDDNLVLHVAREGFFEPAMTQSLPACGPGSRCWFADMTGDGRADYWRISLAGDLFVYPSRDLVDRLGAAALALSTLDQDYERARRRGREEAMIDLLRAAIPTPSTWSGRYGTGGTTWPSDVTPMGRAAYESAYAAHVSAIESAILGVRAELPPEPSLLDAVLQRRWQRAMGRIISARTTLYAGALGATPRAGIERCGNVVVHDRFRFDGIDHLEGSHLARYFDALREPGQPERVENAVGALTAIWEGLRCLSEDEIVRLEAGFTEAVVSTMMDLAADGQTVLVRRMWDRSLPIALLLFDAVHHFAVPQTWRLLQARIAAGGVTIPLAPEPGFDFASAASDPSCLTLWCQTYRHPVRDASGERVLTLDEIGVWLADARHDNRLIRIEVLGDDLIEGILDLRHLGEGDCQLFEALSFGMRCPSARTCSAGDELLAGAPGPLEPTPGTPGSPWSHLFTDRTTLAADNGCDGSEDAGGGGAALSCMGPPIRSMAGRFSVDPAVDRMFRCAMETAGGPIDVLVDLDLDPDCLMRDPPDAGAPLPGGTPTPDPVDDWEDPTTQDEVLDLLTGGASPTQAGYGRSRDAAIDAVIEAARSRGGRVPTREEVSEAFDRLAPRHFGAARSGTRADEGTPHAAATTTNPETGESTISYNPEALRAEAERFETDHAMGTHEFVTMVMIHEFLHVVMNDLAFRDLVDFDTWFNAFPAVHDLVHRPLNLHNRSCGADGSSCTSACGLGEALARRFTGCLEEPRVPTPDDIRCDYQIDYCADRMNGQTGGFDVAPACEGSPDVDVDSDCFVVSCDDGGAISTACCGAMSGGALPAGVFIDWPDPGPMPPPPGMFSAGEIPWAFDGLP